MRRDPELVRAAAAFFDDEVLAGAPAVNDQVFVKALQESEKLADEPELRDFLVDPERCFAEFVRASEEWGFDVSASGPDSELALKVVLQVARATVTDEVLGQIADRLDRLRARATNPENRRLAAHAAVVQLGLTTMPDFSRKIGLVLNIVMRSVNAGLDLARQLRSVGEAATSDATGLPLSDRIANAIDADALQKVFDANPGLEARLSQQYRQGMSDNFEAVTSGQIQLGVFDEEELRDALYLTEEPAWTEPLDEAGQSASEEPGLTPQFRGFLEGLKQNVGQLMTAERTARTRAHLKRRLEDPGMNKVVPFVLQLLKALETEPLANGAQQLLACVMMGEVLALSRKIIEDLEREP